MSLRERTRPGLGIIEPCLPSPAKAPPSGPGWLHEIKHDGFRILARRDAAGVRLITRHARPFSVHKRLRIYGGQLCYRNPMRPFGPDNDVSFGVNGNMGNSYRRRIGYDILNTGHNRG
jgi:hypothetical protein